MSRTANADWSELVILPADASNAKPKKVTDPVRLARLRKLAADWEAYRNAKARDGQPQPAGDPPGPGATSPPGPA